MFLIKYYPQFLIPNTGKDGQNHQMRKLYEKIFPIMLKLSGDEDSVIGQLFEKLLSQTIHWMTCSRMTENSQEYIGILLESILNGLCDNENTQLQQISKRMLHEYVKWSIKQTTKEKNAPVKQLFR